jgi:putative aldouronate transport system substrate-binding protein
MSTVDKSATLVGPMWLIGTGRVASAEEANPGAKFEVLPLLTGPNGQRGNKATNPVFNSWVFRKGLEPIKIEALINQLNWVFEYHVNGPSDKYQAYGALVDDSFFLEGYDWSWNANCEIELTKFNSGSPVLNVGFHHVTNPGYARDAHKYLLEWDQMDRSKLNKGQKFFLDRANSRREAVAYKGNFDNEQYEIEDKFYGPRTKRMNDLWANLSKLETTTFTGIVVGEKPLEEFDKFVADWKSGGGDEFTAGVNQWYATQKR